MNLVTVTGTATQKQWLAVIQKLNAEPDLIAHFQAGECRSEAYEQFRAHIEAVDKTGTDLSIVMAGAIPWIEAKP